MTITLGFSPCPNDTFIFDALVNHKIDTGDFSFDVVLEDVQTLNRWAMEGKLQVSKISYGVLPLVLTDYALLSAGGALGKGVGPLLISKDKKDALSLFNDQAIAIPGENTTANLLFSLAYPQARKKEYMVFSGVEDAVLSERTSLGVIIHENRFTYMQKGLYKVADLGEYWEKQTHSPIPLGGIVVKRGLDKKKMAELNALIRKSIQYAWANYPALTSYVKQHSQEMEESVMRQHIELYVNNYSEDLGEDGKKAVMTLLEVYYKLHPEIKPASSSIFAE